MTERRVGEVDSRIDDADDHARAAPPGRADMDEIGATLDHAEVEIGLQDPRRLHPFHFGDLGRGGEPLDRDHPADHVAVDGAYPEARLLERFRVAGVLDEHLHGRLRRPTAPCGRRGLSFRDLEAEAEHRRPVGEGLRPAFAQEGELRVELAGHRRPPRLARAARA